MTCTGLARSAVPVSTGDLHLCQVEIESKILPGATRVNNLPWVTDICAELFAHPNITADLRASRTVLLLNNAISDNLLTKAISMKTIASILLIQVLFLGCASQSPEAYQSDKAPAARTQYQGVEGANQYAKDQRSMDDADRRNQCMDATVGLAKASADKNDQQITEFNSKIKLFCDK